MLSVDVKEIIKDNTAAYYHPALTRVEKFMTGKFLNTMNQLYPKIEAQEKLIKEMLEMIDYIPCICIDDYKQRGLTQPDCPKCNYIDNDIIQKAKDLLNAKNNS